MYPTPRPSQARPPDSWSSIAASWASSTGLYSGAMAIAVPTRTRLVRAAIANDRCSGEPKYSSEYLCSVVSACEKPSRSAASACSRISPSTACGSPVTRPWVNSTPTDMAELLVGDGLVLEVHQGDAGVEHAGHALVQDAAVV